MADGSLKRGFGFHGQHPRTSSTSLATSECGRQVAGLARPAPPRSASASRDAGTDKSSGLRLRLASESLRSRRQVSVAGSETNDDPVAELRYRNRFSAIDAWSSFRASDKAQGVRPGKVGALREGDVPRLG